MSGIERQIICGTAAALALIGLLVFAAATENTRLDAAAWAQRARSVENGAGLYEMHCRTCHGSRGEGVGQLGPAFNDRRFFTDRIREVGWQDTLESYIEAATAHGRLMATRPMYTGDGATAVMPPWSAAYGGMLRADQIGDVAAFVLNWKDTALGTVQLEELAVPDTNLDDPRVVAQGEAVFRANCSACHTIRDISVSERKGPELTHIGRIAAERVPEMGAEAYIRESFLVPAAHVVEGFEPGTVGHTCGGVLSVQALDAVTAFLLTRK